MQKIRMYLLDCQTQLVKLVAAAVMALAGTMPVAVYAQCPSASITAATPASGTVDARAPFESDGTTLIGIGDATDTITITLNTTDSEAAQVGCWSLCETDSINGANSIISVTQNGTEYTIVLDRAITPGAATAINYVGGAGVTYLSSPGNVDANELSTFFDITVHINIQNGVTTAAHGLFSSDIDHDLDTDVDDQNLLLDILQGNDVYAPGWLNTPLPDATTCDSCVDDLFKNAAGICGCGVGDSDTDTDGDGTPDCNDECPNDSNLVTDIDSDGDGVLDCNDGCPNDINKSAGGQCGCGVAETGDSDGDGTSDCNDGCVNDAAKTSAGQCGCGNADTNSDSDSIADCNDNCDNTANEDQADCNSDNVGDACEVSVANRDNDGDGTCNGVDGCPDDAANVCLAGNDNDNDGVSNDTDNCVNTANPDQLDCDDDNVGDVCEANTADQDDDNDGVCNGIDNCPDDENDTQVDTDNDTVGDVCDNCPLDINTDQLDSDGNGVGDVCQPTDPPPAQPVDSDEDGVIDEEDNCVMTANTDQADADGDGVGDVCDNCVDDANIDQADTDNNGIGDVCEEAGTGTGSAPNPCGVCGEGMSLGMIISLFGWMGFRSQSRRWRV